MQLCFLRHPGRPWSPAEEVPQAMLRFVAGQVGAEASDLDDYAGRDQTRREHLAELLNEYGWRAFGRGEHRELSAWLTAEARGTDQGVALVTQLVAELRRRRVVVPALPTLERLTLAARARARREAYRVLSADLDVEQRSKLDGLLLPMEESRQTRLGWLRQATPSASPSGILANLERLRFIRSLGVPHEWARRVHRNRLVQTAREGGNTDAAHLRLFGEARRHATLVAVVLDAATSLTDETLEMHERLIGKQFKKAERKHAAAFREQGKAINDKVRLYAAVGRAVIDARRSGGDLAEAIESVVGWEAFEQSVEDAAGLARPAEFDPLALVTEGYPQLRRYVPQFLEAFEFRPTPASEDLLEAVSLLRELNATAKRRVPDDAPTGFVRQRWERHVFGDNGIDRRFYEVCVLSELGKALRSGDLWVAGSRRYKDFDEYLLPQGAFSELRSEGVGGLGVAVETDGNAYLARRVEELHAALADVDRLAGQGGLPEASITNGRLKVQAPEGEEPDGVDELNRRAYALLPRVKITDLLVEVDAWCGFTRHFTHLRRGSPVAGDERALLLTAVLADGINLGLSRMADACPAASVSALSRVTTWHVREETYAKALAEVVNHQHRQEFAGRWGDGTTSSSDGQRFATGGRGDARGEVNLRYGTDPGVTFYTHVSDRYAPYHTKLISATVRDATHVLDGLLYHESELAIAEHYTDTAGFTDHVFALCHLLGFRFAPRIRNLGDIRLYCAERPSHYPTLEPLVGGKIGVRQIREHWDELLRLAASIRHGTVTASLMLRKLGSYPRQNGLAVALRELGRIERTLFVLDYLKDAGLRRRIHAGLNKGEARNALAKAVFFNRLGELRDRTHENQRHRASGLNLVVACIALWNTAYLDRAVAALRASGEDVPDELLAHLSPLRWEHVNLVGDYRWPADAGRRDGKLRPLRRLGPLSA